MTIDLFADDARIESATLPRFLGVDFFCGAGGTTRGMIDAGGYVIAGVDKAENCRKTYVENNANLTLDGARAEFLNRDIFDASPEYPQGEKQQLIRELATRLDASRRRAPGVPVMFAICAPCQPFTGLSRKKLGAEREQGRARDKNLLLEAARMVERFLPEIVVSENVAGISKDALGNIWGQFRERLEALDYIVGQEIVSTDRFGIAQVRRRSILVAIRRDCAADPAMRSIVIPASDPTTPARSVRDAIGKYPPLKDGDSHPGIPNHRTARLTDINRRRISHAKPGASNDYLLEVDDGSMALACHKNAMDRTGGVHRTFTDVYTRMSPDRPSPTITTNCHSISNGRFGHYDPAQNRGISLREAAALQSFEDDYVFYPDDRIGAAARMIGNAVPPLLAKFFADFAVGLLKPDLHLR